jgi:hypothetical protein
MGGLFSSEEVVETGNTQPPHGYRTPQPSNLGILSGPPPLPQRPSSSSTITTPEGSPIVTALFKNPIKKVSKEECDKFKIECDKFRKSQNIPETMKGECLICSESGIGPSSVSGNLQTDVCFKYENVDCKCKQLYHKQCLIDWIPRTCPLCRADWKDSDFGKRRRKRRSKKHRSKKKCTKARRSKKRRSKKR